MKTLLNKILLFGVISTVLLSFSTNNAKADAPATPYKLSIEVTTNLSNPPQHFGTLKWKEGDRGVGGDIYRVYEQEKRDGKLFYNEIGTVHKDDINNDGYYNFRIDEQLEENKRYCYVVDFYDRGDDKASSYSNVACWTSKGDNDKRKLSFEKANDHIELEMNARGRYEIGVKNDTDCDYTINIVNSDMVDYELDGNVFSFSIDGDAGYYYTKFELVSNCDNKVVGYFTLKVIYGDKNNNKEKITLDKGIKLEHTLRVGDEFKYTLSATDSDGCARLNYSFVLTNIGLPRGMMIDENTGEISWAETEAGVYLIPVRIASTCDDRNFIIVKLVLKVIGNDNDDKEKGILGIRFKAENSSEFDGFVTLYKIGANSSRPMIIRESKHKIKLDSENSLKLEVEKGIYVVMANVKGYKMQYFDGAISFDGATRVEVDTQTEITFSLESYSEERFKVSGYVLDRETNRPVKAVVQFNLHNDDGLLNRHGLNIPFIDRVVTTETDENGYYSVMLNVEHAYTAMARAKHYDNDKKYELQFYQNAKSMSDATPIKYNGNKHLEGIDFAMVPHVKDNENEEYQSITGEVINLEREAISSLVIAIRLKNNVGEMDFKARTTTDERGYFNFEKLKYGRYILVSIPLEDRSYIPGYYVMGDVTTLLWKEATVIAVAEVMPDVIYTITHIQADGELPRGSARFYGWVKKHKKDGGFSNFTHITTAVKKDKARAMSNEAIGESFVYVKNSTGAIVNVQFTDELGYFEISGLMDGEYTVYANHPGYEEVSESIVIDSESNSEFEAEFSLPESTIASINDIRYDNDKLSLYPLPAQNEINLTFDSEINNARVSIVNSSGVVVIERIMEVSTGTNIVPFDTQNLSQGAYTIILQQSNVISAKTFVIVR